MQKRVAGSGDVSLWYGRRAKRLSQSNITRPLAAVKRWSPQPAILNMASHCPVFTVTTLQGAVSGPYVESKAQKTGHPMGLVPAKSPFLELPSGDRHSRATARSRPRLRGRLVASLATEPANPYNSFTIWSAHNASLSFSGGQAGVCRRLFRQLDVAGIISGCYLATEFTCTLERDPTPFPQPCWLTKGMPPDTKGAGCQV